MNLPIYVLCQWRVAGQWFSSDTPVSFSKTDQHDITEILIVESNVKHHIPMLTHIYTVPR